MNEGPGGIQKPKTGWKTGTGLILVCVLAGVAALVWLALPREPTYRGKSLSDWLSRATETGAVFTDQQDPNVAECREAIRAIGTNAIPRLLRILRSKDSWLRRGAMRLLARQDYVELPLRSIEERKQKVAAGLLLLGDLATNAVPALIDVCEHPSSSFSRDIAENTLMRLYPAKSVAVPYWLPAEKRARWYLGTGSVQYSAGAASNALLAFSQAIQLEPTNGEAYCDRGDAKLQLQDFTAAQVDFEKGMELSPSNGTALFGRGLCRFGLKDFRGAEGDFAKALELDTNDYRFLNGRGLARANLRDFKAAAADFTKAIEMSAYDAALFRNRAAVETVQTEYELALADISKALELDNKDGMTWGLRGRIQCALKNYQAAITNADQAIRLSSKDANAYAARATAYMCLDDFARSTADVESSLRLNPTNASPVLVRALIKAKRGGDDQAALADFERAVELAPQAPETHGLLGWFQFKIGKWEPALANCRKALELGTIAGECNCRSCIWLIRAQSGEEPAATGELEAYLKSLDHAKTNEWSAITARFLSGGLQESNYLSLAVTAAKRPSAIPGQICDSLFYAAMKRKLAGDKPGAVELLQRCLDTKDDNSTAYLTAGGELRALKAP